MNAPTPTATYDQARLDAAAAAVGEKIAGAFGALLAEAVALEIVTAALAAADRLNPAEYPRPTDDDDLRIRPDAADAVGPRLRVRR